MATAQLSATARTTAGKGAARSLRSTGQVPGIVYGHAREAQSLALNTRDLEKLLSRISFENTVVELSVEGKTTRTLIREIQRHPFKRQILHIDFQELVAGELITVSIPLVLVGTPEGVRLSGGILDQVLRDIEIEVDPANIPNHIDVDVSKLDIGQSIHVRELNIPAGAKVMTDEELTVCVVAVPRAAIEAAATAEVDPNAPAEPELIKKGKEDADDEDAPAKK